ncbi:hypothetical protein AB0O75_23095 [Streptomyces sp. NPDC088921]|uniref:hypothetical protein n=1 Tax=unclassified Streptomyces TaxID=2593676 RepID=UPI0034267400
MRTCSVGDAKPGTSPWRLRLAGRRTGHLPHRPLGAPSKAAAIRPGSPTLPLTSVRSSARAGRAATSATVRSSA